MTADVFFGRLMRMLTDFPSDDAAVLSRARDQEKMASLLKSHVEQAGYIAPAVHVDDFAAPGPHGPVPVRIYRPDVSGDGLPLLVWCHGGGWAFGDLDMPEADSTSREIAARASAVVVSVDYRLAVNGVRYPVPLDDVVAAYRWSVEQCARLGVDPMRVTLGGASAGANLAAGAVLRLRDGPDPLPSALILMYPTLHAPLPDPSEEVNSKIDGLDPASTFAPEYVTTKVENYVGGPLASADVYAMPGHADDLRGLPPTLIVNCEFDRLRASGERFAEQLREAGTPTTVLTAAGALHGHINRPWMPQAQQSYADMASWIVAAAHPDGIHPRERPVATSSHQGPIESSEGH